MVEWHRLHDALVRKHAASHPESFHRAFREQYGHDAPAFVRDCLVFLPGESVADYQVTALELLMERRRVAVRSLHGTGKSTLAAWTTLWGVLTADDCKVITTASVWRQLEKYLWPEIHKWLRRLRWDLVPVPRSLLDSANVTGLRVDENVEAFAVASDRHEFIEGAHARRIVYIFDESKAIPAATFDAAEGAFAGSRSSEAFALAISTPGEPSGRFYDICARKKGYEDWATLHVTLEQAVRAGRVTQEWADARKAQWGEKSPLYQNRVLGNFASSESSGVVPLTWVEAANERWLAWKESGGVWVQLDALGVDVARDGEALTVLAPRSGNIIIQLCPYEKKVTTETTGFCVAWLQRHRHATAVVDVVGVGGGVVDQLREQNFTVDAFNAGAATDATDKSGEIGFVNCRSAAWWNLRELLDPANQQDVMLPPDDLLTGDLVAPNWSMTSSGKIKVEPKDEIKLRLGRSTDHGDAVVQAFWRGGLRGKVEAQRVLTGRQPVVNRHRRGPLL